MLRLPFALNLTTSIFLISTPLTKPGCVLAPIIRAQTVILSLYALLLELILNRGPNGNVGQMASEP